MAGIPTNHLTKAIPPRGNDPAPHVTAPIPPVPTALNAGRSARINKASQPTANRSDLQHPGPAAPNENVGSPLKRKAPMDRVASALAIQTISPNLKDTRLAAHLRAANHSWSQPESGKPSVCFSA
jgi:hypothetical protein